MPAMTKAELAAKNGALRKSLSHEVAKRKRLERRCARLVQSRSTAGTGVTAKIRQLTGAVDEARDQQTATAEILRVISSSPIDIQPVLEAVARSAIRVCHAYDAWVGRLEGGLLRVVAHLGPIAIPGDVMPVIRGTVAGRTVIERRTLHVTDLQEAVDEYPEGSELARRHGSRTTLSAPLLREGLPIGVIHIRRREVRPFTDEQIRLLETFADQAVIAIENVRLFTELGEKNRDLTESLERQTATAEILQAISRSPTEVQQAFDAIAESAARLTGSVVASLYEYDGRLVHLRAMAPPGFPHAEQFRSFFPRPLAAESAVFRRRRMSTAWFTVGLEVRTPSPEPGPSPAGSRSGSSRPTGGSTGGSPARSGMPGCSRRGSPTW